MYKVVNRRSSFRSFLVPCLTFKKWTATAWFYTTSCPKSELKLSVKWLLTSAYLCWNTTTKWKSISFFICYTTTRFNRINIVEFVRIFYCLHVVTYMQWGLFKLHQVKGPKELLDFVYAVPPIHTYNIY